MHCRQAPAAGDGMSARSTPGNTAGDGSPQADLCRLPCTVESPLETVSLTLRRVVQSSTRSSDDQPLPTAGTVDTDETGPTTSRPRQNRLSTVIRIHSRRGRYHRTTPDPRDPGGDTPPPGQETAARCRDTVTRSPRHRVTPVATRPRLARADTDCLLSTAALPTTDAVHGHDTPRLPTDCPPAP